VAPWEERPKVVLVTSSLPGEGKTTLALSLARLVARSGRVLVVDLDLRQPNVHRQLGAEPSAGVVEYVAGERTLDEVVRHDPASGLDYVPVGGRTTDPTELVESDRLRDLVEAGRARYDRVVIDSAPVGIITDTRIVARLADRLLYVARWARTPGSVARDGLQRLRDAGIEPAGAVLTQAETSGRADRRLGRGGRFFSRSK
jgi:capsular exopolysaccharide synthesis family protein